MDKNQALGFMLIACEKIGLSKNQASQLFETMSLQFDLKTEVEAEEQGFNWFENADGVDHGGFRRKRNATPLMPTTLSQDMLDIASRNRRRAIMKNIEDIQRSR